MGRYKKITGSAGQNIGLDDALDGSQVQHQLVQAGLHIGSFRGDGHQGASVAGGNRVDGQKVYFLLGISGQNGTQHTGFVVEHELEGDHTAHIALFKGHDGITVLVESTAADVHHLGGFVNGPGDAGGKQALCLGNLDKNFRQSGRLNDVVSGSGTHSNLQKLVV